MSALIFLFLHARKFSSTFLKISERAHHSLLMPVKLLCEIFHENYVNILTGYAFIFEVHCG